MIDKLQVALAVRASILRFCPQLQIDPVGYARLVAILLHEMRSGQHCTKELCEIGQIKMLTPDAARLRFEFRSMISSSHQDWALTLALTEKVQETERGYTPRW